MKYVVAVSGGVDSVALLDMLAQTGHELVVAHYDHGIRKGSAADARFVRELAGKYGAAFESEKGKLGKHASEDLARQKRYDFLRRVASKHDGRLVTAHHQGDVIESIILNFGRGTGWRGLAVMGATDISRPLLKMSKEELIEYARRRNLDWREDPTNQSDAYARNRIRHQIVPHLRPQQRAELVRFHTAQIALRQAIDEELAGLASAVTAEKGYRRHFFIMADESPALELLNYLIKQKTGSGLTRPALRRLLVAIKTGRPGTRHTASGRITVRLSASTFTIA